MTERREHVHLALFVALEIRHGGDFGREELALDQLFDAGAVDAFDQHLDGTVRQLEQLQDGRDGADAVQVLAFRIIHVGLLLSHEEYALVGLHGEIQRHDGLSPGPTNSGITMCG